MTRKYKFADCFWDEDICGSRGWEELVKRLKDGRQMCKDMEDYLRQRAKIEDQYSKLLTKLARAAGGGTEIGTLHNAWEVLRVQTELTAAHHADMQKLMMESAQRLADFAEQQKIKKKPLEDQMKKDIKKKKDLFNQVTEAKNIYWNKCQEAENWEYQLALLKEQCNASVSKDVKDLEKAKQKEQKSKHDAAKADQVYKDLVSQLEQTRQQWEYNMQVTSESFEKMEEERISYIRNELWVCCNIVSQCCVDVDQSYEAVRKSLELCDIDKDIITFIEKNLTGTKRPAVTYEHYDKS